MSQLPYASLVEANSTPRGSAGTLASLDSSQHVGGEHPDHTCRVCKNKLFKQQQSEHTPIECLSQRCEILEAEAVKLKDYVMKSRIHNKDLENRVISLEEAIIGLTAPKQEQAAPFNFNSGQKLRNPFKKAQSIDTVAQDVEINFDNILPRKHSSARERVGLFGSLGASSQLR